jgi:two-component system, NtrC family, nitrogen regulation sensor histidine kinase NtrY
MLSTLPDTLQRWLRTATVLIKRKQLMPIVEIGVFAIMIGTAIGSFFILSGTNGTNQRQILLSPILVAGLMVANLVPAMALMVLVGRRVAKGRAALSVVGSNGTLHVRLVALFSTIAAVPTLLVVIFAALLFQSGMNFWFSEKSRGMFENAASLAQGYYEQNQREMAAETPAMAQDLRAKLQTLPVDSPQFANYYLQQVVVRKMNESAIIEFGADGVPRTPVMINPDVRDANNRITQAMVRRLTRGEEVVVVQTGDRIEAATLLQRGTRIFLYAARDSRFGVNQFERARAVLADYNDLYARSKALQTQFIVLLYVGSLLLVGLAVWAALIVADRLIRPVMDMASAARRVADGDLSARVPNPGGRDEVGLLSGAFNRMTARLQSQTGALVSANTALDQRRQFMETVLSGVRSGVISLDKDQNIRLINSAALEVLQGSEADLVGASIEAILPEIAPMLLQPSDEAVVQITSQRDPRTLRLKTVVNADGLGVITFEDITEQLLDQRRAAWSDVARRIAHEIRNPLTPIQLAAERLQRRYGSQIAGQGDSDNGTFAKLTNTIVRQVGDLRRMVDEFSSFARMPKPVFRSENLVDIVRQSAFLYEVAQSHVRFDLESDSADMRLVCDRHQLAQAFSNIFKNAVEAIEEKKKILPDSESGPMWIRSEIRAEDTQNLIIHISDSGIGLPEDKEKLFEPYMTTREGGTGLGLAIVKKIVEEHFGSIGFDHHAGGGSTIILRFSPEILTNLIADQPSESAPSDENAEESVPDHIRPRIKSATKPASKSLQKPATAPAK